jgi:predicted RNase H-like HicB family nuclease
MKYKYTVHIGWSEDDQAFIAQALELPGCLADGTSQEEALKNLDVVIDEWIETAKELKRDVPKPLNVRQVEEISRAFKEQVQEHINREVQTAVQRVLQDIASSQSQILISGGHVLAGIGDPAEWWKR